MLRERAKFDVEPNETPCSHAGKQHTRRVIATIMRRLIYPDHRFRRSRVCFRRLLARDAHQPGQPRLRRGGLPDRSRSCAPAPAAIASMEPRLIPALRGLQSPSAVCRRLPDGKPLPSNDFSDPRSLERVLMAFQARYQQAAKPFRWTFTRPDLHALLWKLIERAPIVVQYGTGYVTEIANRGTKRLICLSSGAKRFRRDRCDDSEFCCALDSQDNEVCC